MNLHNTEDKEWWIEKGLKAEGHFIRIAEQRFGINISINPEKKANKYSPDLLLPNGYRADLKTVRTPFFKAGDYGMDPSSTVTFNHKDYIRYLSKNFYRAFFILFLSQFICFFSFFLHFSSEYPKDFKVYIVGSSGRKRWKSSKFSMHHEIS